MGTSDFPIPAYLSWGMWVAKCPVCSNAEKFGLCDDKTTGGLTDRYFTCRASHGGCGFVGDADWPSNIEEIEKLALVRPLVNRNWFPGETLTDLLNDNFIHGIVPNGNVEIIGDSITKGALLNHSRLAIEAG